MKIFGSDYLIPDGYQPSVFSVDYEGLKNLGVKVLCFDVDDTLLGLEDRRCKSEEMVNLFHRLRKDFTVILLSNTWHKRAQKLATQLGCLYFCDAKKPSTTALWRIGMNLHARPCEIAHIGDKITVDVYMANCVGVRSILVDKCGKLSNLTAKIYPPTMIDMAYESHVRAFLQASDLWWEGSYYQIEAEEKEDEEA